MRRSSLPRARNPRQGNLRVAVYLRVSTVKQLKGYGLSVQHDECHAWLDYRIGKGKYTVEIYTDGGVSGKLAKRPDLDQLNKDVAAGRVDLVIFGKLDRIGRTMKDIHRWVYDTTDLGVRVATADGRIDSEDEMFGIQLSLLAYMAELEHAMILDRTVGGREKKLAAGGWPGGVAPFWLKLPAQGVIADPTLREDKVRLLETAACFIADENKNADEAGRMLNAMGLFTRRGKPWSGANLIRTFRQTALDGYIIYRNTERIHGSTLRRDEEGNPLYGETVHIPVPLALPPERVAQVRKALASRSFTKVSEMQYLLSQRIFSPCGSGYTGSYRSERNRRTYRCTGKKSTTPCDCKEILAQPMEEATWNEIARLVGDGEHLRGIAAEWLGGIPERAESYRERIAELDEQIVRSRATRKRKLVGLAAAFAATESDADGDLTEDIQHTIEEMKTELREKEKKLLAMRDETEEWLLDAEAQERHTQEVLDLIATALPGLDNLTFERKRELLALLDVRIDVSSGHVGQIRPGGCPFENWFTEQGKLVPPPLTDEQWSRAALEIPAPKAQTRRTTQPRTAFEASLMKVRDGMQWKDLPASFGRPHSVYQRALDYFEQGVWQKAVLALGDYDGTPVPPLYHLPDFKITGSFDARLMCHDTNTQGCTCDQISSCSRRTPGSSSATTGRSCGRCSGPRPTAA
ncbi:recombinase family protein [Streptomyces sp. N35]|uniref:recombinase family protein n=1 Tax=Streptomyces sp. N35 TaxID=2795730 RepID=UPI001F46B878|nr:recombinase family protein [Streptomyces sp. N35]